MKICVDENIPLVTVSELQALQHDVWIFEGLSIKACETIFSGSLYRTKGDSSSRRTKDSLSTAANYITGLLIVRLRQPNEQKIHERVMKAIGQFSEDEWNGLTVVMRDTVQSVSRAS